ncbi:MAG: hypothetical protein ACLQME_12260 [Alphaproteobacteria bacterium]
MVKLFGTVALLVLAFAGTAMACGADKDAMSTPTVTTAQGNAPAPATPAPQTPNKGG